MMTLTKIIIHKRLFKRLNSIPQNLFYDLTAVSMYNKRVSIEPRAVLIADFRNHLRMNY